MEAKGKKFFEKERLIWRYGIWGYQAGLPREQEGRGSNLAQVLLYQQGVKEREGEDL